MRAISQKDLDRVFAAKGVRKVLVVRNVEKGWFCAFDLAHPITGTVERHVQYTTRNIQRYWSDPRPLFQYLSDRYGVLSGSFELIEDNCEEPTQQEARAS